MIDQDFNKALSHPLEVRARAILKRLNQPFTEQESVLLQLAEYCLEVAVANRYETPLTKEEAREDAPEYPEWHAIQTLKRDHKGWPMHLTWLTIEEGEPLPGAEPYWREHHDPAPNDPDAYEPIEVIPRAEMEPLTLDESWDCTEYSTATNLLQTIMLRLMDSDFEQTDW